MSPQLPLQLRFPAERRFEDFEPADAEVVHALREAASRGGERLFVAGAGGSGKTHLLQAACAHAATHARSFAYLPLATFGAHCAEAFDAQPVADLVAIDGLDAIAGDGAAERALFALHNRQHDAGASLIHASRDGIDALPITLPDLRSRLQHCRRFTLQPLDESARRRLLQQRALRRGLQLDEAVLDFLFRRVGRDLGTLGALLDRIDRESLAAQRRVTVPFVRGVLGR